MNVARSLALLLVFAVSLPAATVRAAEDERPSGKSSQPNFDPTIGKRINQAIEAMQDDRFDEAREVLDRVNLRRASPFEVSRVEQIYAAIDQSQERYAAAREHLERAMASGGLNDQEQSSVRFQIAKLLLVEEKWADGVAMLEQWFAKEPAPNSAAYYTLAVAYYQVENLDRSVQAAQKAVDLAHGKPQESWLQLLLALRLRRQEYHLAYPILVGLIEKQPDKKTYWVEASSAAMSQENYPAAATLLQLAYTGDLLEDATEIRRLAELLLFRGIPHRAATILAAALKDRRIAEDASSYELLGNCWIAARDYDKALAPLARAGELATSGEPYLRLAEIHAQRENWQGAIEALQRGIDKGKLKRPGLAQFLMGMAHFNLKKLDQAKVWFQRAATHRDQKMQAEAWLKHTENALSAP